MKLLTLLSLCLLCNSAIGKTGFIDLFTERFTIPAQSWPFYRYMNATCPPKTRCARYATNFADYASRCIAGGCRPAMIHKAWDRVRMRSTLYENRKRDFLIGLSDRNSAGQVRWINGRRATSPTDKEFIEPKHLCPTCRTCFAMQYTWLLRRRCASQGLCECRAPYYYLERITGLRAVFNKNDDVMGGFYLENETKLSVKGTIATEKRIGKIQIILYLNLRDTSYSEECKRAEGEKQDTFLHEEVVELGNYGYETGSPTTSKKALARVHADLGEFEFPLRNSPDGPILSIEAKDLPALSEESKKYFIVIWQYNKPIGCSGVMDMQFYKFFEQYNKALIRYSTGVNLGTSDP